MREGAIIAEGRPSEIITAELIEQVYGLKAVIIADPIAGTPMIVPVGK